MVNVNLYVNSLFIFQYTHLKIFDVHFSSYFLPAEVNQLKKPKRFNTQHDHFAYHGLLVPSFAFQGRRLYYLHA